MFDVSRGLDEDEGFEVSGQKEQGFHSKCNGSHESQFKPAQGQYESTLFSI